MVSPNHMTIIGEAIIEKSKEMAEQLFDDHDSKYQVNQKNGVSEEKVIVSRQGLYKMIGEALISTNSDEKLNDIYKWGIETGKKAVRHGISPDIAMLSLSPFRKVLYQMLREEFRKHSLGFDAYFDVSDRINPMLDQAVYSFTQAYVEYNDETHTRAQEDLLELSVPVVPLTSSVAILPVIGTIDTYRSKKMLDQALERGSELGLSYLIIDLSGVRVIDTAVARNLFQLNDALKIVGITGIISGLRPELAQTIVSLGISFNHMNVTNSLEQALMKTGLSIQIDKEEEASPKQKRKQVSNK
ncbi:STAS domain-containing protein [Alteribacter populi]|uniref:STAS domain-containing protein n=1 Tax=Alteribacter populi TaxID=2011011 RepID=UPI000BBA7630|nr:STAS domain-containing protein [Alteribacter populi]